MEPPFIIPSIAGGMTFDNALCEAVRGGISRVREGLISARRRQTRWMAATKRLLVKNASHRGEK
jgi:hypothetical protein